MVTSLKIRADNPLAGYKKEVSDLDKPNFLSALKIIDLGLVDFSFAYRFQQYLHQQVCDNKLSSSVLLCRHHPVITVGRSGDRREILSTTRELEKKGIKVFAVERGGKTTYHGPGQLTIYPIIDLVYFKKDLHLFLRCLERLGCAILREYGIKAQTKKGLTGVWVGDEKIISVGIAVKKWVSFHGLSINLKKEDALNFSLIRPCGLRVRMTSIEGLTDKVIDFDDLKVKTIKHLRRI